MKQLLFFLILLISTSCTKQRDTIDSQIDSLFHIANKQESNHNYSASIKNYQIIIEQQKEEYKQSIEQYNKEITCFSSALLFITICNCFYICLHIAKKHAKTKNKLQQKILETIEQAESIEKITHDYEDLQEVSFKLSPIYHHIKKSTIQARALSENENKQIFEAMDLHYNSFTKRLQQSYSTLSERDIIICCYIKLGLRNKEIAVLLNMEEEAIYKQKNRIRKQKMELTNSPKALASFLKNF